MHTFTFFTILSCSHVLIVIDPCLIVEKKNRLHIMTVGTKTRGRLVQIHSAEKKIVKERKTETDKIKRFT